jgi:hypothetical protein
MRPISVLIPTATLLGWAGFSVDLLAQKFPVVHWINDSGVNGATVLNTNGVFVTDFKARNDFKVTRLAADSVSLSADVFGGPSSGNNPWYCAEFVGAASNGTGDGTAGDITDLNMTSDTTGSLQFDFLSPLTPQDRILLVDIDGPEEYLLKAYIFDGTNYNQASTAGWTPQDFTGTTGELPNADWPVWNATNGTAYSGAMPNINLDQELFALTPDQNIDRLQIYKLAGSSWSSDITFENASPALTTPAVFSLQASSSATGPYTNIIGATSPYTNVVAPGALFFRLQSN